MDSNVRFTRLVEADGLLHYLQFLIPHHLARAIKNNGVFRIGVSGGSIAPILCEALISFDPPILEHTRIFFCDERFVDATDKYSTYRIYRNSLLHAESGIKEENIVGINTDLTLKECAQDYEEKILKEFNMKVGEIPQFDMLFIGIGPDGHTCSLFPQHEVLNETEHLIAAVDDSPKPPPQRITMTLPLINNAKCVVLIAIGEEKAGIIKRIFVDKEEDLPVARIKPLNEYICVTDRYAGNFLPYTPPSSLNH